MVLPLREPSSLKSFRWLSGLVGVRRGAHRDGGKEKKPYFNLIFKDRESAMTAASRLDDKKNKLRSATGAKSYLIVTPWEAEAHEVCAQAAVAQYLTLYAGYMEW